MSKASDHHQNRLLASLPKGSLNRLRPHLEWVPLTLGQVLHQQHVPFEHVSFPTTAVVSLVSILKNGASAEIGMIGHEGMVGTSLLMGGADAACQAVVQIAGEGYRLKIAALKTELKRSPDVWILLLRYVQALLIQTSQTAVCNRHHSVDQQLCRWLLLSLDRVSNDKVHMTQELIAQMLGVRRVGVSVAAGKLQAAGLITYHRGTITVLDRPAMEARSCECYGTVKHETQRLLQKWIPPQRANGRKGLE